MNADFTCDIIQDLIPGYVEETLSEAGTGLVKAHLEHCEECRGFYEDLKAEMDAGPSEEEKLVLDGFKKIQRRTRRLKVGMIAVSGLLASLVLIVFLRVFVIGGPLETHLIQVSEPLYNEDTELLTIKGTLSIKGRHVSRVVWKQSTTDANAVNIIVYAAETLPFMEGDSDFTIEIPNMKGQKAYLACPEYDQLEVYNWGTYHYEMLAQMEAEICRRIPGWDETRDVLDYTGGVTTVDGKEGISYYVTYVIGHEASYWRFNDQIITDGEFKSADFEIWISLESPYEIRIFDYQTGEWSQDFSVVADRRPEA